MSSRPDRRPEIVVLVTGTATEVGKTWVGAELARLLTSRGVQVAARKPAQSLEPHEGPSDSEVLAAATGEPPEVVCPARHTYPVPMAPPMAAEVLGWDPPTLHSLVGDLGWPAAASVGLVEAAGSVRSPQADDGDGLDLAAVLRPEVVVVVADAGLGAIGAVRMALAGLSEAAGGAPVLVVLNRWVDDDLGRRNLDWLRRRDGCTVFTCVEDLADDLESRISGPDPQSGGSRRR